MLGNQSRQYRLVNFPARVFRVANRVLTLFLRRPSGTKVSYGGPALFAEISRQGAHRQKVSSFDISLETEKARPRTAGVTPNASSNGHYDWFDHCFTQAAENVELCLPVENGEKTGIVRFDIAKRLLSCHIGNWVLARLPMRVARFSGHAQIPDAETVYDRLFSHILDRDVDAIYLDSVRPETLLWRYLQSNALIQNSFRFYSHKGPLPHSLIRLSGSFSDYMKRFSPKTRKNRLREIKMLRQVGDVKLTRITEASEIEPFLKVAYEISQRTRQYKQYRWSIAARDPRLLKNELLRLAQHGSLRSYLLTCGGVPCSFILGQQTNSRFYPVAAGVNPLWREYSVGTVLLLLALEDLFKENTPEFYDLGTSAKHKEYLATERYLEAEVWLFRRRPYSVFASRLHAACNAISNVGGAALARIGAKDKVMRLIRRFEADQPRLALGTHAGNVIPNG